MHCFFFSFTFAILPVCYRDECNAADVLAVKKKKDDAENSTGFLLYWRRTDAEKNCISTSYKLNILFTKLSLDFVESEFPA